MTLPPCECPLDINIIINSTAVAALKVGVRWVDLTVFEFAT